MYYSYSLCSNKYGFPHLVILQFSDLLWCCDFIFGTIALLAGSFAPKTPFYRSKFASPIRRSLPSAPYLLFLLPYREHNSAGIFLLLLPTLADDLDHVRKYKHRLYSIHTRLLTSFWWVECYNTGKFGCTYLLS